MDGTLQIADGVDISTKIQHLQIEIHMKSTYHTLPIALFQKAKITSMAKF